MNIKEAAELLTDSNARSESALHGVNRAIVCNEMQEPKYVVILKEDNTLEVSYLQDNGELFNDTYNELQLCSFYWQPTIDEVTSDTWRVIEFAVN